MKSRKLILNLLSWALVILAVVISIYQAADYKILSDLNSPLAMILMLSGVLFVFIHSTRRYGWKSTAVFFILTALICFLIENISVITGFPLGRFHYNNILGVKNVLYVPITIPLPAFSAIYISWTMAIIILGCVSRKSSLSDVFVVPVIAAFIFAMWNTYTNPHLSYSVGLWTYENGGAYFGVPFEDVFGMFLYGYIIYQVFALFLYKHERNKSCFYFSKDFWIQSIFFNLSYPITYLLAGFFVPDKIITAADKHIWYLRDLYQSSGMVAFVTGIFICILAFVKLSYSDNIKKIE